MTSLLSWMYNTAINIPSWFLYSTGIYSKNIKLIILGLDNAGKTTLLQLLENDTIKCHQPTRHPTTTTVSVGGLKIRAHDMGGHLAARKLWDLYIPNVDCIIFMVDSSNAYRFEENRKELQKIITEFTDIPIIVVGNKIDLPTACSEYDFRRFMGLSKYDTHIKTFMCSVVKRAGVVNIFKWMNEQF